MATFFGFALADSMFNGDVAIQRRTLTVEQFLANCLSVPYADSYYSPRIRRAVKRWLE